MTAGHLDDQRAEIANLNYWAYWLGELPGNQVSDDFIAETSPYVWHGDRILRHVADRLHGEVGLVELNVHTLYVLLQLRPHQRPPAPRQAVRHRRAQREGHRGQTRELSPTLATLIRTAVGEYEAKESPRPAAPATPPGGREGAISVTAAA